MVGIELPGEEPVTVGPTRDLVAALHELYRGAGRPGLRKIAGAIADGDFRDTVGGLKPLATCSTVRVCPARPRFSASSVNSRPGMPRAGIRRPQRHASCPSGKPQQGLRRGRLRHSQWAVGLRCLLLHRLSVMTPGHFQRRQDSIDESTRGIIRVTDSDNDRRGFADSGRAVQNVEDASANEWIQSRHALLAGWPSWSEPADDIETAELRHLWENQISHPAFAAVSTGTVTPPSMRVAVRVTCTPLPAMHPASSAVRSSFLALLHRQPVADLIREFSVTSSRAEWHKWGGNGRSNHEMVLVDPYEQAAPLAWARLLLPEPKMPVGWRQPYSALLVLHIDRWPRDAGRILADPIPFLNWHIPFMNALGCPALERLSSRRT